MEFPLPARIDTVQTLLLSPLRGIGTATRVLLAAVAPLAACRLPARRGIDLGRALHVEASVLPSIIPKETAA